MVWHFVRHPVFRCRPGGDWAKTWHWTKRFTIFIQTGSSSSSSQSHIFFLSAFLEKNIIIILGKNCTKIIIWINKNNAINNNNYGMIFLFKFPMGERKNFFELYRQSVHASTRRFASPGLPSTEKSFPQLDNMNTSRMALYSTEHVIRHVARHIAAHCFCVEDTPDGIPCDFINRWLGTQQKCSIKTLL